MSTTRAPKLTALIVSIWGQIVGTLRADAAGAISFSYADGFRESGLEISPLNLPLDGPRSFMFPELTSVPAFGGLPGVFADALPDRFGTAVMDAWFARQGRAPGDASALDRLAVVSARGLGALTFAPADAELAQIVPSDPLELSHLMRQSRRIVRGNPEGSLDDLFLNGSVAGGMHPKAVILLNPETGEMRSDSAVAGDDDEHWLIKLDGVGDIGHADMAPRTYNRIEHAYSAMARAAGITTPDVALLHSGRFVHLLSRRFDRVDGQHLHRVSLGGIDHADFNASATYSYERYLGICRALALPDDEVSEAFRRVVFNTVAVNHDDHAHNFGFVMGYDGMWHLAPAYDVTYAHGKGFTRAHQLTIAGKVLDVTREELIELAASVDVPGANAIIEEVIEVVKDWVFFAEYSGVPRRVAAVINGELRVGI